MPAPLPSHPSLSVIKSQAKKAVRQHRDRNPRICKLIAELHPEFKGLSYGDVVQKPFSLHDAQLCLARYYGFSSWAKLKRHVQTLNNPMLHKAMRAAIHEDDLDELKSLVESHPELLSQPVKGHTWGPPMSYAANLGRTAAVELLLTMGASDLQKALGRAVIRGKLDTARWLLAHGAKPHGCLLGPCESLNPEGIRLLLEHGADPNEQTDHGQTALELAICTYTKSLRQHECVNLLIEAGARYVDGPAMDIHRSRLDQLKRRLEDNPELVNAPARLCRFYGGAGGGAPLNGATLLHICAEYNALEAAKILLDRGADVNRRAVPDRSSSLWPNRMEMWRSSTAGMGDQTPIFHAVNSIGNHCMPMVELLIEHGADLSIRASILLVDHDKLLRDVTPLTYALRFIPAYDYQPHRDVLRLLRQHGAEE